MIIYHVQTFNYLPRSKKNFECRCEAYEYVESVIEDYGQDLGKYELIFSIRVTRIDDERVPNYKKMFPEKEMDFSLLRVEELQEDLV
jgi:hypothetical protein